MAEDEAVVAHHHRQQNVPVFADPESLNDGVIVADRARISARRSSIAVSTAGAGVFEARHLEPSAVMSAPFIAGVAASAVFAFLAIKFLLRFVRNSSYTVFVIYRLGLAVLITSLYLIR